MFRKSLVDIEKQKRDLLKQKQASGPLAAIGKGNALVRQSMDSNISIPELIKRQRGRSRKRNSLTIGSKGGSKKRVPNTRLPSLTNESIKESSELDVVARDGGAEALQREELPEAMDSKPTKRTRGSLTLPVFLKSGSGKGGDTAKANTAAFYTGSDPLKKRKNSEERTVKADEKLKLPAINMGNSKESTDWT